MARELRVVRDRKLREITEMLRRKRLSFMFNRAHGRVYTLHGIDITDYLLSVYDAKQKEIDFVYERYAQKSENNSQST